MMSTENKSIHTTERVDGEPSTPTRHTKHTSRARRRLRATTDLVIFAMLGALTFALKMALAGIPNIEPVSLLIIVYTAVYRFRALIPIYIYVFLEGLVFGFTNYWIGYLYIWAVLWLITMLLPRRIWSASGRTAVLAAVAISTVSAIFGLLFGALFAPAHAIVFGFKSWGEVLSWIAAGLVFDISHTVGNFAIGLAAIPLVRLIRRLEAARTFK